MVYLSNAFSLQMLTQFPVEISVMEIDPADVPTNAVSVIGHADTAAVVSSILGREVPANRTSISLDTGDELYVAQLIGGRLPEGSTTLPEGFSLKFFKVTIKRP